MTENDTENNPENNTKIENANNNENNRENADRFESLDLIEPLLKALNEEGYTQPTPVQRQAIPHVLARRDLLACAQTGTGKTAAFGLPILQLLAENDSRGAGPRKIRALVLTPTRELAAQIAESFTNYGRHLKLSTAVVFGGVGQGTQVRELRGGIDILVATPGRLLDLIEQRHVSLEGLEFFVLDEADRMLDMGFIHDVKRVIKVLPKKRQSLFFSATMPPDIVKLANDILSNPVKVEVTPAATTVEKIDQLVFFADGQEAKRGLLAHLLADGTVTRALVFTRTKHGADRVTKFLNGLRISAEAIHGNKSQNNRVRALESFKKGETRILVATDIAARGIDIDDVSHVINYEIPNIPETYVHRIGRTARAGAEGVSFSFCDQEERDYLRDIERLTRQKIRVVTDHPFASGVFVPSPRAAGDGERRESRGGGQRRDGNRSRGHGRGDQRSRPQNSTSRPPRDRPAAAHAPARSAVSTSPRAHGANSANGANRAHASAGNGSAPRQGDRRPHARGQSRRGSNSNSSGGRNPARSHSSHSSNSLHRARPAHPAHAKRGPNPAEATARSVRTAEPATSTAPEKKKSWWKRLLIDDE